MIFKEGLPQIDISDEAINIGWIL